MHSPLLQIFAFNTSTTRLLRNGCLSLSLILTLAAFLPTAQAALPPPAPDGGYPMGTLRRGRMRFLALQTASTTPLLVNRRFTTPPPPTITPAWDSVRFS